LILGFESTSESEDEFEEDEEDDFRFLFDFFLVSFFDFDCFTAFFGDFERVFELERDRRSRFTLRFWAGETCFEDFEGLESLDLDLPLRSDSDFLSVCHVTVKR